MKLRTAIGVTALFLAAAMPATSLGQRNSSRYQGRGYYGHGPFQPSRNVGGYRNSNRGVTGPIRLGGVTAYFGPGGGGYGYPAPSFYYGSPYPSYGYTALPGYGYPLPYGYSYGYGYGRY